jgi:signal transduction histidine kinase
VMMPGLSGLELVKTIKGDANLAGIPVMLLSARAGEEAKVEGLASGADEYLVKPFAPRELVARVGAQIGMSRSATERLALLRREQDARREAELQKRSAESANRAKDEFLAILGHEMRNPLSPIVTALELMRLKNGGVDAERAVIERQVAHLSRLVDDLLDVSRITGGKVQLQPRLMEIAEAVNTAIEMTTPLLETRRQVLTVDVPISQLKVNADATRLAQVISNLLSNASKFSSDHGTISISASEDAGQVVLKVADQGAGIAPEVLPKIFDLFVQEHQDLDRRQGGLGLGLTIVRNLVELHRGTVSADSEGVGKGTTFTIRLPLAAAPVAAGDTRNDRFGTLAARGDRVLIVDDNEDSVAMLATMLQALGYETRTASDSPMALKIVSEYTPDIAFVDIGLPVVNGYELAKRLRAIDRLSNLRLIAFTGYGQSADRERAREAGFSFHLVKPLDMNALNEALRH